MTHSAIYRHKSLGFTVQITHWDFFFVNRGAGITGKNWCRYQVLDGDGKGLVYQAAINWFLDYHNPVGG